MRHGPASEADALYALTRPLDAKFDFRGSTGVPLTLDDCGFEAGELPLGYGSHQGSPGLRSAISELYGVAPECVLVLPGATFALFLAAFTFLAPGDHALIVRPSFPSALGSLRWVQARIGEFLTSFDEQYALDPARLATAFTPELKLLSLASPQNPSGISVGGPVLEAMAADLAKFSPDAVLLVDETFREAAAAPQPTAVSLADNVVVLGSLSKAHGAAGLRIGWAVSRNRGWIKRLEVVKAQWFHSVSILDEAVALAILRRRSDILERQAAHLSGALRLVEDWAEANSAMAEWRRPDAGAICTIRPRSSDGSSVARFDQQLAKRGIALAPGPLFGDRSGIYRLGFGSKPASQLEAGLEALRECLAAAL